jgi:hypothetical protein
MNNTPKLMESMESPLKTTVSSEANWRARNVQLDRIAGNRGPVVQKIRVYQQLQKRQQPSSEILAKLI